MSNKAQNNKKNKDMEETKKFWFSKKLKLQVEKISNPADGKIFQVRNIDGSNYENAGILIKSVGIERFWDLCLSKEEFDEKMQKFLFSQTPEFKKMKAAREAAREEKIRNERIKRYEELKKRYDVIPATYENIGIILRYLSTMEYAKKDIYPCLSIGYSFNHYDCDGKPATALKLDRPIEVNGEMVSKFQVGAPIGHLSKYHRA